MKRKAAINKTALQVVLTVVLVVAGVSLAALLGSAAREAANNASKLCAAVHTWGGKGFHPSYLWPAREALATRWWQGPLRSGPPLDLFLICGPQPCKSLQSCWWWLLLQARKVERPSGCLDERTAEAEVDQDASTASLWWIVALGLAQIMLLLGLEAGRYMRDREVTGHGQQTEKKKRKRRRKVDSTDVSKAVEETSPKAEVEEWAVPVVDVKKKRQRRRKKDSPDVPKEVEETSAEAEVEKRAVPVVDASKYCPTSATGYKPKEENGIALKMKEITSDARKPALYKRKAAPRPHFSQRQVRDSWKDDLVTVQLPVAPAQRRHVIGPQGDTIAQLIQNYPRVHVVVPPMQDTTTAHVTVRGPKTQVAAAARDIVGRLKVIEDKMTRKSANKIK